MGIFDKLKERVDENLSRLSKNAGESMEHAGESAFYEENNIDDAYERAKTLESDIEKLKNM